VRASVKRQDLGLLENWLRQIRDVYRLHKEYLDLIHVCFVPDYVCVTCVLLHVERSLRVTMTASAAILVRDI
jgi:hypothetical protein